MANNFPKYVLDNMSRATLSNAFNISNKFEKEIDFLPFLKEFAECVIEKMNNGKLDAIKAYHIMAIIDDCTKEFNTNEKVLKRLIYDNFVLRTWEVLCN